MPGAIGKQDVHLSGYGHSIWGGNPPIGKGRVYEEGDQAIFEGQFNLEMRDAAETYAAIKFNPDMQEFSWGFNAEFKPGDHGGRRVNYIENTKIYEVSPVVVGAGIGTGVLDIKEASPEPEIKLDSPATINAKLLLASLAEQKMEVS